MPAPSRVRKGVELAPAVYGEIEQLVSAGYWLSFQEFAREALKEKLDRWKQEHPGTPASAEAVSAFGRRK